MAEEKVKAVEDKNTRPVDRAEFVKSLVALRRLGSSGIPRIDLDFNPGYLPEADENNVAFMPSLTLSVKGGNPQALKSLWHHVSSWLAEHSASLIVTTPIGLDKDSTRVD